MATQLFEFSTTGTWLFTGSAVAGIGNTPTASIICVGAGGRGAPNGTGGSGGAYATKMVQLVSGSRYNIVVGSGLAGDGGYSSFALSGSATFLCKAAGGKQDGTVAHQVSESSGSTVNLGGIGGENYTGYSNYNGGGGGGAGGPVGNGLPGLSGQYATATSGAPGGMMNAQKLVPTYGGSGSFYYAGANVNKIIDGTAGEVPGGGGGGGYDYPVGGNSSGAGGNGYVSITLNSLF